MLITSGLKGSIEDPGYYLNSPDSLKAWTDLDKLLMTQGWVSFNWPEVFVPKKPILYPAESQFIINGKVTNLANKGVANAQLVLFSKKPMLVIDTLADANGRFSFRNLPQADTAIYMIQSRTKRGTSFNVGIEVDEFVPPVFSPVKERFAPWYLNSDTLNLKSTKSIVKEQNRYDAPAGVNVLGEVVVTAQKIVKNSKNRNGAGNADYILDEKDILEAKKEPLRELLQKRFGFIRTVLKKAEDPADPDTIKYIMLKGELNLVIDGVFVRKIGALEDLYMDFLTAEDITGIEIMASSKYAVSYDPFFIKKQIPGRNYITNEKDPPPPIYVEVTTRSGSGAYLTKTPGVYLYKPLPYSFPVAFYRPKYHVKEAKPAITDLRTTIHWEPNIITGLDGRARVSFYSGDLIGKYSFILEGTDFMGGLGFVTGKVNIR